MTGFPRGSRWHFFREVTPGSKSKGLGEETSKEKKLTQDSDSSWSLPWAAGTPFCQGLGKLCRTQNCHPEIQEAYTIQFPPPTLQKLPPSHDKPLACPESHQEVRISVFLTVGQEDITEKGSGSQCSQGQSCQAAPVQSWGLQPCSEKQLNQENA